MLSVMIHVAECTTVSLNKSVHVICIFCSQHFRFLSLQQDKRPSDRICTCTQRKISLIQQNISLLLLKKKIKLQKKISLIWTSFFEIKHTFMKEIFFWLYIRMLIRFIISNLKCFFLQYYNLAIYLKIILKSIWD